MTDDYDILIKNATIVDGTGEPAYKGSLGILGEKIAAIGNASELGNSAKKILDVNGFILSPGIIDVHNHGDHSILYYPTADGFLRQGITTFVGGQCGSSPGPYGDIVSGGLFLVDLFREINLDMYYPSGLVDRDILNEKHRELFGWEIDWKTMGEFCRKVTEKGVSPNYVPMVGHGNIRYMEMGEDFERTATKTEIEDMKPHVKQAMEDGCHGMSVGRDYDPGYYATKEEIIELAKETTDYDAVYASHSLRTGLRKARRPGEFPPPKIIGILEAIDVGRQAGVSVQISHLGSLYDVYPGGNTVMTEAAAKATLAEVDRAIEEGINVNFDLIPNIRGFGVYSSTWLVASLLPWLRIAGSREQLANALRMHAFREEIKEKIWAGKWYSLNPNINKNWASGSLILECKEKNFINKNIAQIAKEKGKPPLDTLMDVIMTDPYTRVGGRSFSNPSKDLFYQHPTMMAGVDTFAVDTTWEVKTPPWWLPSENSFGGFAAYFRMIVREEQILSIEEAIKHVTSLPAKKFSLTDRGVIKPGAYADIMIMDLEHVTDKATPLEPRVYPEGIPHVFVNGVHVINESNHTGEKPGLVLLRE